MFKTYEVFQDISALFILVPAILGLKGNLDMCLASRLSTQANLGKLEDRKEIFKMVVGNIGLVQVRLCKYFMIFGLIRNIISGPGNSSGMFGCHFRCFRICSNRGKLQMERFPFVNHIQCVNCHFIMFYFRY